VGRAYDEPGGTHGSIVRDNWTARESLSNEIRLNTSSERKEQTIKVQQLKMMAQGVDLLFVMTLNASA